MSHKSYKGIVFLRWHDVINKSNWRETTTPKRQKNIDTKLAKVSLSVEDYMERYNSHFQKNKPGKSLNKILIVPDDVSTSKTFTIDALEEPQATALRAGEVEKPPVTVANSEAAGQCSMPGEDVEIKSDTTDIGMKTGTKVMIGFGVAAVGVGVYMYTQKGPEVEAKTTANPVQRVIVQKNRDINSRPRAGETGRSPAFVDQE